MVKLGS